jgi:hypothetical protein
MRKTAYIFMSLIFVSSLAIAQESSPANEDIFDKAQQEALHDYNQATQSSTQEVAPETHATITPPPPNPGQVRPVPYSTPPQIVAPAYPPYAHPYYNNHPYDHTDHPFYHPFVPPHYHPYTRPYTGSPYSNTFAPPPALTPRPIIRRPPEPSTNPWVKQNHWETANKPNPWADKPNPWRPPEAQHRRVIQNPPAGTFVPPVTQQSPPQIYVTPPQNNPPVNSPTTY